MVIRLTLVVLTQYPPAVASVVGGAREDRTVDAAPTCC